MGIHVVTTMDGAQLTTLATQGVANNTYIHKEVYMQYTSGFT